MSFESKRVGGTSEYAALNQPVISYCSTMERGCKTKMRMKFRDRPCESLYTFLQGICVLHNFTVDKPSCARGEPVDYFRAPKTSHESSLRVSCMFFVRSLKFVRRFSLHEVEQRFPGIFRFAETFLNAMKQHPFSCHYLAWKTVEKFKF